MADSPRDFRTKNLYSPPPREYKPPSLLTEHRRLAIAFAAAAAAFAVYCLGHAPHPAAAARAARSLTGGAAAAGAQASGARMGNGTSMSGSPSAALDPSQPIYVEAVPDK